MKLPIKWCVKPSNNQTECDVVRTWFNNKRNNVCSEGEWYTRATIIDDTNNILIHSRGNKDDNMLIKDMYVLPYKLFKFHGSK